MGIKGNRVLNLLDFDMLDNIYSIGVNIDNFFYQYSKSFYQYIGKFDSASIRSTFFQKSFFYSNPDESIHLLKTDEEKPDERDTTAELIINRLGDFMIEAKAKYEPS